MTQARGVNAQLLGGVAETTYGTTPVSTNGAVKLPIISSAIKATQNLITSNVITGRRDGVMPSLGNVDVAGAVVVPVDTVAFGFWLQMLFGNSVDTGTGPYVHTWKVGPTLRSWVLEHGFTDINQFALFNGCKVNSMALTLDQNSTSELQATFNVIGASQALSGASMCSTPTVETYTPFKVTDLSITEGGVAIASVQSLAITEVTNNLDNKVYCIGGAGKKASLPEGLVHAKGTLKAMFQDATLLNKAVNYTTSSIVATLTSGTNVLSLKFDEVKYAQTSPPIPNMQGLWADLSWEAFYGAGADNSIVTAVLTNGLAAYVA